MSRSNTFQQRNRETLLGRRNKQPRTTQGRMRRIACFALLCGACLGAGASLDAIPWKTPGVSKNLAQESVSALLGKGEERHLIVQFKHLPTLAERTRLRKAGIDLQGYLGAQAYFAMIAPGVDCAKSSLTQDILAAGKIPPESKLHPLAAADAWPEYACFSAETGQPLDKSASAGAADLVAAYVLFFPGALAQGKAEAIILLHDGVVQGKITSIEGLVALIPKAAVYALAEEDWVQWIEPPLPPLGPNNDSNRVITQVDEAQEAPYGLDGSGVTVLVFDGGTARATHADFSGRLRAHDSSGMSDHSTHVAGTIGGDGSASEGQLRGMAPGVTLESYGNEINGSGFLYTDPCDIEHDYSAAINTYAVEIANNSIGSNVASNGFPCSWEGDYGATSILIDSIVRGKLGAPMRIVWSAGNENNYFCGSGYHLTPPPSNAKNHICVGALNAEDDSMTSFSSWGPSDDGRLKPDIAAPGCQNDGDGGVTSCSSSSDTAYTTMCGTSMAAPTVTGICALILQDWKARYPGEALISNALLKALLAHTAVDLGNTGPDYQFGYGSVRAKESIDFLRSGNFFSGELDHAETLLLFVQVAPGDAVLKATLAWDDVPGTANTAPELVNDLDIVAIEPGTSTLHYPWTLDPESGQEANPAIRTQADHVNNLVQVCVDAPAPGVWLLQISGYAVPQGPQSFGLTASPNLMTASPMGIISFNACSYACEDTLGVTVADTGLNTDPQSIETVEVLITSDTKSAGESMTLTEADSDSPLFSGTLPLSSSDQPGSLQINDGDTLTGIYEDAEDGTGVPATVTAIAHVDCTPPTLLEITPSAINASQATLFLRSDEAVRATIQYGPSCGQLDYSVSSSTNAIAHRLCLTPLTPDRTWYYSIELTDEAGNQVITDNGGACYSFTTPEQPDYVTQLFSEGFKELDGRTFSFMRDGSGYRVCMESADAFPSDPAGGTTLVLGDDNYAKITFSDGNRISFFGHSYDHLYVNSNGNLTFGRGDHGYEESLINHFSLPRFSGCFDDLDPSYDGTISWRELSDRVVVTYENIPQYDRNDYNSFQMELFWGNTSASLLTLTLLEMDTEDGLIGLSEGLGLPGDFIDSNFLAYPVCTGLKVSPLGGFEVSGPQGGPFSPQRTTFELSNTGTDPLTWRVSSDAPWFDFSLDSGSLAPEEMITLELTLNLAVHSFDVGNYIWPIIFRSNGYLSSQYRSADLAVSRQMSVTPDADFITAGMEGGPFSPASITYTLTNQGDTLCDWLVEPSDTWITATPAYGALAGNESVEVTIALDGDTLDPGDHIGSIALTNVTYETTVSRGVEVSVAEATGDLVVTDSMAPVDDQRMPFGRELLGASTLESITLSNQHPTHDLVINGISAWADAYAENFNDEEAQGWACTPAEAWSIVDGELRAHPPHFGVDMLAFYSDQSFQDGAVEVTLRRTGDLNNLAYIFFRAQEDFDYAAGEGTACGVAINGKGKYCAGKWSNGHYSSFFDWRDSSKLLPGENSNTIKLILEDRRFRIYFNGEPSSSVWSGSLPLNGRFGFAFAGGDYDLTSHYIDDFRVSPLQAASATTATGRVFALGELPEFPFTLAPGATLPIPVTFSPAHLIDYSASIQIQSNDFDEPKLSVALSGTGYTDSMQVLPESPYAISAYEGGPFTPPEQCYTLSNSGPASTTWIASVNVDWLDLSLASGALEIGAATSLTLSPNAAAAALANGEYEATLSIVNEGSGMTLKRAVTLEILNPLVLTPETPCRLYGGRGGPFQPALTEYTLSNPGLTALDWRLLPDVDWIRVTPTWGSLAPGASTTITFAAAPFAALLPEERYDGEVVFTNESNGRSLRRALHLHINPEFNGGFLSFPLDTDPGWTTEGNWAFGTPAGNNGDPDSAYTGNAVYGYNLDGAYEGSMPAYSLTTTALDCSAYDGIELLFWRWLGVEDGNYDQAAVEVSNDGATWTEIWRHNEGSFNDDAWVQCRYDISAIADGQATVYIRWIMGATDSSIHYCGWNLDDITLIGDLIEAIDVAPTGGIAFSGVQGGAFSPAERNYQLTNTGTLPAAWSVETGEAWLVADPPNGQLDPGATTMLTLSLDTTAATLDLGLYTTYFVIANDETGFTAPRLVSLEVADPLTLSPETDLVISGPLGGPFTPDPAYYTLTNQADADVSWNLSAEAPWADIHPTSGALASGEAITIELTPNALAATLQYGRYEAELRFENLANGALHTRRLRLEAGPFDILCCVNTCEESQDHFSTAFENLGVAPDLTSVDSLQTLIDYLNESTWDLVVVDAYAGQVDDDALLALKAYYDRGGRLIFFHYNALEHASNDFWDAAGIQIDARYTLPYPIHAWFPDPFFTTPNQVPDLTPDQDFCNTDGQLLSVTTANAIAGYTSDYQAGKTALSLDPQGRLFINAFAVGNFQADQDLDGKADIVELLENELFYLLFDETQWPQTHETHRGDYREPHGVIELSELLRFIQFFNMEGFHCAQTGEESDEGYIPGPGHAHDCHLHTGDYEEPNWEISLGELLRFIQFFNSQGYHLCNNPYSDEGYCPDR